MTNSNPFKSKPEFLKTSQDSVFRSFIIMLTCTTGNTVIYPLSGVSFIGVWYNMISTSFAIAGKPNRIGFHPDKILAFGHGGAQGFHPSVQAGILCGYNAPADHVLSRGHHD